MKALVLLMKLDEKIEVGKKTKSHFNLKKKIKLLRQK